MFVKHYVCLPKFSHPYYAHASLCVWCSSSSYLPLCCVKHTYTIIKYDMWQHTAYGYCICCKWWFMHVYYLVQYYPISSLWWWNVCDVSYYYHYHSVHLSQYCLLWINSLVSIIPIYPLLSASFRPYYYYTILHATISIQ
jgi:hypothetical protein